MAKTAVTKRSTSNLSGALAGRNGAGKRARETAAPARNGRARDGRAPVDEESLARVEQALRAAAAGDFSIRLPGRRRDTVGRLESAYNQLAARNAALEAELIRVGRIIGREGRMTERARLHGARGAWRARSIPSTA